VIKFGDIGHHLIKEGILLPLVDPVKKRDVPIQQCSHLEGISNRGVLKNERRTLNIERPTSNKKQASNMADCPGIGKPSNAKII
jgi:hypothetical protein